MCYNTDAKYNKGGFAMSILSAFKSNVAFDYKTKLSESEFMENILKADFSVGNYRYRVKEYNKDKGEFFIPCKPIEILGHNSFIPDIKLNVVTDEQGTKAQVKLRPNKLACIFFIAFIVLCFLFQLMLLVLSIIRITEFSFVILLPFGMVLFAFLMLTFCGYFTAKRVKGEIMRGVFGE